MIKYIKRILLVHKFRRKISSTISKFNLLTSQLVNYGIDDNTKFGDEIFSFNYYLTEFISIYDFKLEFDNIVDHKSLNYIIDLKRSFDKFDSFIDILLYNMSSDNDTKNLEITINTNYIIHHINNSWIIGPAPYYNKCNTSYNLYIIECIRVWQYLVDKFHIENSDMILTSILNKIGVRLYMSDNGVNVSPINNLHSDSFDSNEHLLKVSYKLMGLVKGTIEFLNNIYDSNTIPVNLSHRIYNDVYITMSTNGIEYMKYKGDL